MKKIAAVMLFPHWWQVQFPISAYGGNKRWKTESNRLEVNSIGSGVATDTPGVFTKRLKAAVNGSELTAKGSEVVLKRLEVTKNSPAACTNRGEGLENPWNMRFCEYLVLLLATALIH